MTIRLLSRLKSHDDSWAGPKACSLGWLMRHRYRVPPGFCIGADVYDFHITQCESGDIKGMAARIQQTDIPAACLDLITRAYERLNVPVVAIRSSATAEDLRGCSFAGQYETVLNVESLEQCLEAVKQCWASLWSERVRTYCRQNGIDHSAIKMAVIVQQQVEPDWAGVAFTAHPVSGSPSRIVVEACRGLGEKLVGGEVTADRYVLRKKNLFLLSQRLADEREISIPLKQINQLARQARRLERQWGHALDIEWALSHGQLYLLQVRPVTTAQVPEKSWSDRQVWTNFNVAEVVPDVATPMTRSVLQASLDPLFTQVFALIGAQIGGDAPIAGWVAGRLYFNLNTFMATILPFQSWIVPKIDIDMAMGGHQNALSQQGQIDIPDEDLPDLGFRWPRFILSWPRLLMTCWRHSSKRSVRFKKWLKKYTDSLVRYEPQGKSRSELVRAWEDCFSRRIESWDLLYLIVGGWVLPVLDWMCRRWIDPRDPALILRLLQSTGGMDDTRAGLDLWALASLAHQDEQVEALIVQATCFSDIKSDLATTQQGQSFLQAWSRFMWEHGHHCRGELEVINARWCERPDYILNQVQAYLSSLDRVDVHARQQAMTKQREQLTEACRQRLRYGWQRRLFDRVLRQTQQVCRDRENWKNQAVRQLYTWRRILLALGDQLCQEGILLERDDIFFLQQEEVGSVASGWADFDVAQCIADRRDLYQQQCDMHPPHIVMGRFDLDQYHCSDSLPETDLLRGIGSSPGVVVGPARVIHHCDDRATVRPGEILVAPTTDPAWTPYFIPAAGVVIDQGGLLSHGSIIAREYGIPAVVNVPQASRIIQTGQLIRVDADHGIVTIVEGGEKLG